MNLTERERTVARLICSGMTNKEIGRALGVEEITAKTHAKALYRKTGSRNRPHLAYRIGRGEIEI